MRFISYLALMAAIALIVGFGLSYFALTDGRFFGAYQWSSWITRPEVGSPTPDPYTRAYLARNPALQLGRGEGIQFTATHDDSGERLIRSCDYSFTGETPVAAFWTLRAVGQEGANIAASGMPRAMNSKRLARAQDGSVTIHIGKTLAPGNWLAIDGEGDFQLVLTFYDASFFAGFGSTVTVLPEIIREAC